MANITDPEVVLFNNLYLRPIAEKLRDLALFLDDAATEYTTNIAGKIAGNAAGDVLVDGRANEGVTQVTKADLTALITHVQAVYGELNGAGNAAMRAKFTVRPPSV